MDKQKTTAILGPENSFHHIAASSYFGNALQPVFKHSFEEIFNSVSSGESDNAIIAVKNTYAGFVGDNLICIAKNGLYILDEVKLQIRFFLAVNHLVEPMEIHEIISHPIAIKQCAEFLKKFPNTTLTEVSSTAEAANLVANDARKNIAVLAGEQVIEQTKLIILEEATLEQKDNITRFVVVSKTFQTTQKTSHIIISVEGDSTIIFTSIGNTSLEIREHLEIPNSDESYFEFICINSNVADLYIASIKKHYPEIRVLGYYAECEKIVNT
ncbi:MAG: prephenate dehydratase domain-containing protein [Chitinophagales bacterium]|nr:hypothetical protein [Bacteroidota bacterium]MBK8487356.1 hypothetical protein [Bacteroidota bacterium]MBK8682903.1 hypothetical protein [Bacteroidota bacterium]MBP9548421.1 hypothetical protein [Chitinophagales bacterium]